MQKITDEGKVTKSAHPGLSTTKCAFIRKGPFSDTRLLSTLLA